MFAIAFSRSGNLIATASQYEVIGMWNTGSGQLVRNIPMPANTGSPLSAAFLPNGAILAVGTDTGQVNIFAAPDWKPARTIGNANKAGTAVPFAPVWQIDVSRSGTTLADAGGGDQPQVWDTDTWTALDYQRVLRCTAVTVAPYGRFIAFATDDKSVLIVRRADKHVEPIRIPGTEGSVSSDGGYLAIACSDSVMLFEVKRWRLIRTMVHTGRVRTLAFSPMVGTLVAGEESGSFVAWKLRRQVAER